MEPKTDRCTAPEANAGPRRRVGSLTLGVCLIAAGILFLCCHFVPGFDAQLALRIAPAAGLILLGCEVLFFAARPERGKYDFVSVFVCLVLMACCFGLLVMQLFWEDFDPQRRQTADRLGKEYTALVYEAIREDAPDIALQDVGSSLYLSTGSVERLEDLHPGNDYLTLTVNLYGPYASAEEFAADCRAVTDAIQTRSVQPDVINFACNPLNAVSDTLNSGTPKQTERYWLSLNGMAQQGWTKEQMTAQTEVDDLRDEENEPDEEPAEQPAEEAEPVAET